MIHHFTVSAVILEAGRVLLVRHRRLNRWIYPGGHLEQHEDPIEALRREIREELSIDIDLVQEPPLHHSAVKVLAPPFVMLSFETTDATDDVHRHVDLVYLCRHAGGTPTPLDSELTACAWVPIDEVAALDVPLELPEVIRAAAERVRTIENGVVVGGQR